MKNRNDIRQGKGLSGWEALFIAFIAVSVIVKFVLVFYNNGLWWDEAVYLGLAEGLQEGRYGLVNGVEAFRPPLFPLVLVPFGADLIAGRLLVTLFSALATYVMYIVGKEWHGRQAGLAAAAVISSYELFVFFGNKLLSETLFVFLFTTSFLFFNRAVKKNHAHEWILAGAFTALAFLTRYPATVVIAAYILYGIYKKYYRGVGYMIVSFAAILVPWLVWNTQRFGVPWSAYQQSLQVFDQITAEPWTFFITGYFETFGVLGVLFIFGALAMLVKKRVNLVLLLALSLFVVFSIPEHKELRYMVSFFPLFALVSVWPLKVLENRGREAFLLVVLIISVFSLISGTQDVIADAEGGQALVRAAEFVKDKDGAVLTEFYTDYYPPSFSITNPWLEVLGEKESYVFPKTEAEIPTFLQQHPDIRYAVVYAFDPRVPEYASDYAAQNWQRIANFSQWGNPDGAIVYEIPAREIVNRVSVTLDDGLLSHYTAADALDQYGFKSTFYIPSGLLDGEFEGAKTMNVAQVQDLAARGHEIGGHTRSHVRPFQTDGETFERELNEDKAFMAALGIETSSFAYPYGELAHEGLVASKYSSGRNVIDRINLLPVPEDTQYKLYAVPVSHQNYQRVSEYLQTIQRKGGWLILTVHNIVDNETELRPQFDLTQDEFRNVLEQIKASNVRVVTVREVMG